LSGKYRRRAAVLAAEFWHLHFTFATMLLRLLLPLLLIATSVRAQHLDSIAIPDLQADSVLHSKSVILDSIQRSFYLEADSIKSSYKQQMASLTVSRSKLNNRIDSLRSHDLSADGPQHELDSINAKSKELAASLDGKMNALKAKTGERIKDLGLPKDLESKASGITQKIDAFQLPVKDLNIPDLNLPDSPLKNLDGLNTSISSPVGEIGNLPAIDGLRNVGDLSQVTGKVGDLSELTGKVGDYGQDIQKVTGAVGDVQNIPGALEEKAADVAGLPATPDAKALMGDVPELPTNTGEVKDLAGEQVQQAVNHFAGKEQVLEEAMAKMSKLKRKYSSLNSLSEIPKRRPNEMRGKPLIERILPSLTLQVQGKGEFVLVDVTPAAGYRFTGKLTAGLGWNHRIAYSKKFDAFSSLPRVYGPRSFAEYKIGKGFSPRAEFEFMNAPVPPLIQKITADYSDRKWVSGAFVGIKKEYKIFKNIRGTSMVMLRIYNPHHKSPYADVINVRVGFEFPMKKKPKVVKQEQ
jgi:hypothetical protein